MAGNVSKTKLGIEVDESGFEDAKKAFKGIQDKINAAEKAVIQFNLRGGTLGATLSELSKITRSDSIRELGANFGTAAKFMDDATVAAADLAKELERIGASEGEIKSAAAAFSQAQAAGSQGVGSGGGGGSKGFGGISQGFGAAGALASQVNPAAGQFLQLGQQISNAAKDVPNLVSGISGLAQSGGAAVPLVGSLAAGISGLVPVIGGVGAGIAAVSLVAAPFIAIAAAVAIGIKNIGDNAAKAGEEAKKNIEINNQRIDNEREAANLIKAANADAAKARIEELKAQQSDQKDKLTKIYQDIADNKAAYAALGASFNPGERAALGEAGNKLEEQLKELYKGFPELGNEIDVINKSLPQIEAAAKAREDEASKIKDFEAAAALETKTREFLKNASAEDIENRVKGLKAEQDSLQGVISKIQELPNRSADANAELDRLKGQLTDTQKETAALTGAEANLDGVRSKSQKTLDTLAEQASAAQAQFAENASDVAAQRRTRDERADEDYADQRTEALKSHNDKLVDIAQQGRAKIAAINTAIADIPAERQAQMTKAEGKYNADVSKINSDYMKSELAAVRKFAADEQKVAAQSQKDRLRSIQDLGDQLADAELANDVVRFIQTKREGEKKLAREAEDAGEAAQARAAQFAEDRAAADAARQERLAQSAQQLADDKIAIEQAANEKRAALAKQIIDEQAAIVQRTQAEIKGFQDSEAAAEASRQKRLGRQREDDATQDAARKRTLDRQLADIQTKTNAEIAALNAVIAKAGQLGKTSFGGSTLSTLSVGSKQSRQVASKFIGAGGGGKFLGAFAEGGIVPKGTSGYAFLEGKRDEAIMPLDKMNGGGGQVINLTVSVNGLNVGAIASPAEVTEVARQLATQAGHEVLEMIAKAVPNARFRTA